MTYINGAVTRNASEKKINSLLDHVGQSTDMSLLQASPACVAHNIAAAQLKARLSLELSCRLGAGVHVQQMLVTLQVLYITNTLQYCTLQILYKNCG